MPAPQFDLLSLTYTDHEGEEHNAFDHLMKDGNLGVPGGRYGSDTRDCAYITLLLFLVFVDANGENTVDLLNGLMSDVVNSGDEVCWSILDGRHVFYDYRNGVDHPLYFLGENAVNPYDFFSQEEIEYSRELWCAAYLEDEAPF